MEKITLRNILDLINSRHVIVVYRERTDSTPNYHPDDKVRGGECDPDVVQPEPTKYDKSYGEEKIRIQTNMYGNPTRVIPTDWLDKEVKHQFPTPDGHLVLYLKSGE